MRIGRQAAYRDLPPTDAGIHRSADSVARLRRLLESVGRTHRSPEPPKALITTEQTQTDAALKAGKGVTAEHGPRLSGPAAIRTRVFQFPSRGFN
jgi:hypothetical protein